MSTLRKWGREATKLRERVAPAFTKARKDIFGGDGELGAFGTGTFKPKPFVFENQTKEVFTSRKQTDRLRNELKAARMRARQRKAPTAAVTRMQTRPQQEVRGRQMSLADALAAQAAGEGPSLAARQLEEATGQNIAQSMALAASQRGATAGQGLRQIGQQTQLAQQQAARDAATMRIQEQLAAREQLGGVLSGTRAQDIGLSQSQAQLQQQRALANQQAALRAQELKDAQERFLTGQITQSELFDLERAMQFENLKYQAAMGDRAAVQAAFESAAKARGNLLSGIGSTVAAAAAAAPGSDKNMKKNIEEPSKDKMQKFLDALKAYEYEYKEPDMPGAGEGKFISPMAQDMEKSELGKGMVMDTPEGKMVDYGKAGGLMLGVASMLNERMDDLEAALKRRKK